MYAQVEKQNENKSRAVANSATQKKSKEKQGFGFVDNRAKTVQRVTGKELDSLNRLNGGRINVKVEDSENRQQVEQRLEAMIGSNCPQASSQNISRCVQYMLSHDPKSGGGIGQYNGDSVFHISHGKKDGNDGVSIFFIHVPPENIHEDVKIIGIGQHTSGTTYKLDWGVGTPWVKGANIKL
ncbi:MAG: hypothetical protein QTN59_13905 [Candidatus Electrothrix communis]|nr:MAG: hypothetical protein QTN59_13905 [Candidatus Electrothrix communis]